MTAAFSIRNAGESPIIVSVPHAGRDYGAWVDMLRLSPAQLYALEDPWVDLLVSGLDGPSVAIAHVPRAIIDLNRDETDLDPRLFSGPVDARPTVRARGGLGLVPSRLAELGSIWRGQLTVADLERRLASVYRPWHLALANGLQGAHRLHGHAVLIDLHSMPSQSSESDIVLGDRFGRTASSEWVDLVEQLLLGDGLTVARNAPYAGGAVISRHGQPHHNIHAIQIEINRRLYLRDDGYTPSEGLPALRAIIARLIANLASEMPGISAQKRKQALAAE
jgi:N-formylglutamate amidohydrolase